jgi:hypothetical protein
MEALMRKRYTEEPSVQILQEGPAGKIGETCRKHGIGETAFFNRRGTFSDTPQSKATDTRLVEHVREIAKRFARWGLPRTYDGLRSYCTCDTFWGKVEYGLP